MRTFALACVLFAAASCSGAPKSGETLMESLLTYHEGLRWQRFAAAAGRLPAAERSAFIEEWDQRSRDLKITEYEILDVALHGDSATVGVRMSWYGESEGRLRDTHARQSWRRRGKVWILVDEVRARGDHMPGLAEPAGAEDEVAQQDSAAVVARPPPSMR